MQSIHRIAIFCKRVLGPINDWAVPVILVLVGFSSFALGRLSALDTVKNPVVIYEAPVTTPAISAIRAGGEVVALPYGKTYFAPWCTAAEKFKKGSLRLFPSAQAAKNAGLLPAKNCPGLE